MMIIHKIHVTSKMVRIGYIENIETAPRAYTLKSAELDRPELYDAMTNVFETLADGNQCFIAAGCQGIIEDITVKYNRDNSVACYILSGAMKGEDEVHAKFQTEKIYTQYQQGLNDAVYTAIKEAELFVRDKRAQMTLEIEAAGPKSKGGVA